MKPLLSGRMQESEHLPFAVEIRVSDFERSLAFYRDRLGFQVTRIDEPAKFAALSFNDTLFMLKEDRAIAGPRGQGVVLRFLLPDGLKAYHDQVKDQGAPIAKPLERTSYGLTRFFVEDPDGYRLKFAARE